MLDTCQDVCVCIHPAQSHVVLSEAVGGVEYGWLSNWASLDKTFIFRENTKAKRKASMTTRRETMSACRPGHQSCARSEVRPGRLLLSSGMQFAQNVLVYGLKGVQKYILT